MRPQQEVAPAPWAPSGLSPGGGDEALSPIRPAPRVLRPSVGTPASGETDDEVASPPAPGGPVADTEVAGAPELPGERGP
eukprot:6612129-Alexandrium_andersonii.AAC.1